jgi:hypothetical protein
MLQFFILLPLLIFLSFIAFYIPGSLLVNSFIKSKISIIISFIVGLALWGLQAWIFGLLNLSYLTYLYILTTCLLWIKLNHRSIRRIKLSTVLKFLASEKKLIFIILIGVIIQLPAAWFFGIITQTGMSLTSNMPSDLQWQASLVYQLTQSIPPNEPGMYNMPVNNYHYFGNIIIAEFVKIFHLPLLTTTFQYFSIILSLFLGLAAVAFSRT